MASTATTPSPLSAVIAEAQRIEEDAIYSSKSHFEASRSWEYVHLWIGVPMTILAAVAGVSALSQQATVSGAISLLVAATSAVFTFLNPRDRATKHLTAGNAYKALHNDARIFRLVDCSQGRPIEELTAALKDLNNRRNTLNAESPAIPRAAFERARKGIEAGETTYLVDGSK